MLIDEYFNAGLFDFYQLLNSNGDLYSYDELAEKFRLTPNNYSFIKHIKLMSAIPNSWLDNSATTQINFALFKNKVEEQVAFLGQTSKRTYTFLRDKEKILPIKLQQKWCDTLQMLLNDIDWNRIYENNYLAANETKLRSFQIRLNMRSIVTNVQRNGMGTDDNNHCVFCSENPDTMIHYLVSVNLLTIFGKIFLTGFR